MRIFLLLYIKVNVIKFHFSSDLIFLFSLLSDTPKKKTSADIALLYWVQRRGGRAEVFSIL
jgi:hypothetical protein